jgi:putative two-component system response regulator
LEVCRRLKCDPKTRHIPVIIITGLIDREANIKALEAGADDFLLKPVDSVLLEARIRNSVEAKALHDQILHYQHALEQHNETLEARICDRTAQLVRTQQVVVFSLAKLAESRDTETGEHLHRIRRYAQGIALELARKRTSAPLIDKLFIETLFQSGPLHDIGKVGIPDRILLKPGKLTIEEFDIMKTHTLIGGDTLKAADVEAGGNSFLAMGRDVAYFHHERWDGSGYPARLEGEATPLAARIVALSDVYDALTSKRPYKEAMSHEEATGIILAGRGGQFDPDVVDAFVVCEGLFEEIHQSFGDKGRPSCLEETVAVRGCVG